MNSADVFIEAFGRIPEMAHEVIGGMTPAQAALIHGILDRRRRPVKR